MKRTLLVAALLAMMMPTTGRADDAAAEKQVATTAKHEREAMIKGDTEALGAMMDDTWVGINPKGEVADKAKALKDMKTRAIVFESMEPLDEKVRVYGDAAIVTGRYHAKVNDNGHLFDGRVLVTEVFTNHGGKWRCVSSQVTFVGDPGEKR